MKKGLKTRTLREKIFSYFFTLIMSIILILDGFFLYKITTVTEKNAHSYSYEIIKQLGRNVESYVEYMKQVSWVLSQDSEIRSMLKKEVIGELVYEMPTLEQFKMNANIANDIESIIVFGTNGVRLVDNDQYKIKNYINVEEMDWYKEAIHANGNFVVSLSHIQNYIENNDTWVFSVSRSIIDKKTKEVLGVMLIDMSYKKLADICNQITLGNTGYVYIMSQNKDIIYHPQQQLIYSGLKSENLTSVQQKVEGSFMEKEDKTKLVTVHTLPEIGWTVVGVSYFNEFMLSMTNILLTIGVISLICVVLSLIVAGQISQEISKPILELEDIMSQVEKGDLSVNIDIETNTKEIQNLSGSLHTMLWEIRALLRKIKENETDLRKSELKVLQAQINPHFLYNALDTIIWLGERKENDKVVLMTSALAKYFRLSLSKGAEVIPLFNEIEHIKYYLQIQKIRYEEKLNYSIRIDPNIYEYLTVKIILQPLVENAIYHGIKDKDEEGFIFIEGHKEGDNVILSVQDNGKGMTKEQMETILTRPISLAITKGGVAIKNVHQRIQVYFGQEYGLSYQSELGKGTKVTVTIPALTEWEGGK
ncbi:C50 carotenoid epsilon cyclase [Sporanaerobium hydrogeniformans]|uniref:C50 carotenoid epsilon cyclase n=1 Tax=Sporanaerobium hydrogeniformans TaxID=3072179 RepID=A0AC61DH05_9FIRM|nr:sensor histidine kinase [Sporanaerobium hydrogeniformans]PHV72130.1 C50 carotenoid epsilon cyclase [Sporanaerobium hydrogeniformans]